MTSSNPTAVVAVNGLNFEEEVTASPLPVLIDVSTPWCGPCKVARPIVEEFARRHAGELKVVEIDGGESPDLVARLGVRGFPTFIGMRAGQFVDARLGFGGKRPLEDLVGKLLDPA
ncbi:MAG TPA: thioredoxin domain-containing protein [Polyangiaceae bacterium]|jgi:thioredoxin-like negative regulator of GroEL|nr:thioredoxin domain-containing protein [Polyangiaceae bacterium]